LLCGLDLPVCWAGVVFKLRLAVFRIRFAVFAFYFFPELPELLVPLELSLCDP
jgi:hypothetical protein